VFDLADYLAAAFGSNYSVISNSCLRLQLIGVFDTEQKYTMRPAQGKQAFVLRQGQLNGLR
jgi:hypothetical protein